MGLRSNGYCKVWDVTPKSDTVTSARVSCCRKNKMTNEYEQDFSGFLSFVGTVTASKAAALRKGELIRIKDFEVTTRYDAAKNTTYTNYTVFSFEDESDRDAEDLVEKVDSEQDKEPEESELPY